MRVYRYTEPDGEAALIVERETASLALQVLHDHLGVQWRRELPAGAVELVEPAGQGGVDVAALRARLERELGELTAARSRMSAAVAQRILGVLDDVAGALPSGGVPAEPSGR